MPGPRLVAGLALALVAATAQAHPNEGSRSLRELTATADLVLHGRILEVGPRIEARPGARSGTQVEAAVLGVLKGSLEAKRVVFRRHDHGPSALAPGEQQLLFLVSAGTSEGKAPAWTSLQEHDDAIPVEQATRRRLLRATRAYATAEVAQNPKTRDAALARARRELINAGDPALAQSVIDDIIHSTGGASTDGERLAALVAVVEDPGVSMGMRAGLVTELGRRGMIDTLPLWLTLLSEDLPQEDRLTAALAVGPADDPAVDPRLVELLKASDTHVAAAAARSLGRPGNVAAIDPLAEAIATALDIEGRRIRNASIRSLARIGTPEAFAVLERTSETHPDQWTRIRAGRELLHNRGAQEDD